MTYMIYDIDLKIALYIIVTDRSLCFCLLYKQCRHRHRHNIPYHMMNKLKY